MLVTESQLRKIIRKSLRDYHLVKEIFDNSKKDETKFVESKLKKMLLFSSEGLRDSIDDVTSDPGRGEVKISLSKSGRAATDREVACAVENFIKKIRQSLKLKWLVRPCRYDDKMDRDVMLVVGI